MTDADAIVVGSGAAGGWAAKELTEAGIAPAKFHDAPTLDGSAGKVIDYTDVPGSEIINAGVPACGPVCGSEGHGRPVRWL